jgi:hypothetical protein
MEESEKEDSWVPTAITASYGRKNTIAPEAAAAPMMHTEQMIIHMTDGLFMLCSISPISSALNKQKTLCRFFYKKKV